eukprot:m.485515 g.485515  ORF g.485515 m.485515 type:complete len:765 (-) comp23861_c0_seq1:79-2373(-)
MGNAGSADDVAGVELGSFAARYLGSVSVKAAHGNDVCSDAVTRVKHLQQDQRRVTLRVTHKGVFVIDVDTHDVIKECEIGEVSFVSMDPHDKKLFSFIQNQTSLNLMFCHVFSVKAKADGIPVALNQAFQISAGKVPLPQGKLQRRGSKKASLKEAKAQKAPERERALQSAMGKYEAKYIGSVAVAQARGNEIVLDALERIKVMAQAPRKVELLITESTIEVFDAGSQDPIKRVPIMDVSFTAADPKGKKWIALITNDARLSLIYCHAFAVDKKKTEDVLQTISAAFQRCAEALKDTTDFSPERLRALEQAGYQDPSRRQGSNGVMGVFEAKFLGAVPAGGQKGQAFVEAAVLQIKTMKQPTEGVVLLVTPEGIRAVEGLTGEIIGNVFIRNISFSATAGERRELFCFMARDERLSRVTCHVFECGVRANEVSNALGEAFKVASAEAKAIEENPFKAVGEREPVSGELFRIQIHRSDLKAGRPVGAGQFGQVYLAEYSPQGSSPMPVAVKMLRRSASDSDRSEFLRESEVMLELQHPSLVRLLGVAIQQRPWLCVIEYMNYGDLRAVVQTCQEKGLRLSLREQIQLLLNVVKGLVYIAKCGFIHMDVAARNCLLHHNNEAKVADFGLTRKLDKGKDHYVLQKTMKLPVKWMAVEGFREKLFSEASDVWAFGIVIWEILSYGTIPYKGIKTREVQALVAEGLRLEAPEEADPALFALAASCWHENRKKRPSFVALEKKLTEQLEESKARFPEPRDIGLTVQQSPS